MKTCHICGANHNRRKYCSEECRLESKRITARLWNRANKERHAQHQRDHKSRDPELFRQKERKYYLRKVEEKPGYFSDKTARRNAIKKQASPEWLSEHQKNQIQGVYATAARMTELTGIAHHVDHIEPLQGGASCGLHVPWNLQILTSLENTAKSNRENRKVVYLLCGQSGVGKTTLLKKYEDVFNVVCYDKVSDAKLENLLSGQDGITVVDIAIKISTVIKRYGGKYFIRPIFMVEPPDVVSSRISDRGGKISNVLKRYNRMVSLSNRYAYYSGNTEEVEYFLDELKNTLKDRYDRRIANAGHAGRDA